MSHQLNILDFFNDNVYKDNSDRSTMEHTTVVSTTPVDYQRPLLDEDLRGFIKSNVADPFEGTEFSGYTHLNPKQKGIYGEMYVSKLLKTWGKTVEPPVNTGHDRIVDEIKTEIKFGLASKGKQDCFMLNHVSKGKDWDRLIFMGINRHTDNHMYWMDKRTFSEHVDSDNMLFSYQQGGKQCENDDYMITGPKLMKLVENGIFRSMEEW